MSNKNTETVILDAARKVFVELGPAKARMQDVAEEADITQSLLHYYFRRRDDLFEIVFNEELKRFLGQQSRLLKSEKPLMPKLKELAHEVISYHEDNPHLAAFVAFETHYNPERAEDIQEIYGQLDLSTLQEQLDEAARAGEIHPYDAHQVLVNIMSLTLMPFVAMPIIQHGLGMDDETFQEFIDARKKEVPKFIERALTQ